jgi:AraC-like DNA-binding protein
MIANHISDRVINYVESNYSQAISLRDVALVMGYSPCHLTTVFRRATGTPVTAWIVRRRIEAARQLLLVGTISVAEASERVGFSDLCYFTRQFVRHVGMTPGRFRATTQITANASSMARSRSQAFPVSSRASKSGRGTFWASISVRRARK